MKKREEILKIDKITQICIRSDIKWNHFRACDKISWSKKHDKIAIALPLLIIDNYRIKLLFFLNIDVIIIYLFIYSVLLNIIYYLKN